MRNSMFLCTIITIAAIGITSCTVSDAKASTQNSASTEAAQALPGAGDSSTAESQALSGADASGTADTGNAVSQEPSSSQKVPQSPVTVSIPTLTVTCGQDFGQDQKEIPSSSGGYELSNTKKDGTVEGIVACGAEPLSWLIEKGSPIPYIKPGTNISLKFTDGSVPDAITLQDIILREDGTHKYGDATIEELPLTCTENTASFTLGVNMAAMLSSDMSSYEEGGILRGFRVNCTWENGSSAEYGFVLRTDASE